ncbi:hypothetical protein [Pseudomonas saudiphocaensis]|uniref:hypothetical protein n=1 Tax=Pseudomonas saudiphocaensis TaxID=1499686 RepID=UPI00187D5261|nr:hypothetical protein [Pseudomonas saudiphocaensis]MBE7927489.1 hypothetical protein [Pseudomonas saudiphocaensis]
MSHIISLFASLVFFLIFFFVLISPQFVFLPYELSVIVVPVAALSALGIYLKSKLSKSFLFFIIPWGFSFGYILTLYVLQGQSDSEFVVNVGKLPFFFFAGHFVVAKIFKLGELSDQSVRRLANLIFICLLAQAIVMSLSYIYPWFDNFLSLFVMKEGLDARVGGFQSLGRDSVSMNQAAGALFLFFVMLFMKRRQAVTNIYYFSALLLIVGSSILSGRTGFFLFVASGAIFLSGKFMLDFLNRPTAQIRNLSIAISVLLMMLCVYPFLKDYAFESKSRVISYSDPIYRILEPLRKQGEISSLEKLRGDMVIFPESDGHLIFGDGHYGRSEGVYVSSDIGYIRMIYGMGLVGLTLFLSIFASMALNVSRLFIPSKIKFAFLSFLLFGFLGHLKIVYLSSGAFFFLLSIFYFLVLKVAMRRDNT